MSGSTKEGGRTMTALQLRDFLDGIVRDGYADARILFDTEARTFNYCMAEIGSVYLEDQFDPEQPFVRLG